MLIEYFLQNHFSDCVLMIAEKDDFKYFSVKIDFLKLFEFYPDIGDKVLCNPIESLPICNDDIVKTQKQILDGDEYRESLSKLRHKSIKKNVHARFYGLPVCPELHRTIFPKNADLGCFLKVSGTVVRVSQSKMLEYKRKYVCVKCKYENMVEAEFENRYVLKAPTKCTNPEKCRSSTFTEVNLVSRLYCKDYQEIKIQEQVNKLSIGTIPGSMWVVLDSDLVDTCKPGDDVHVCGTVRRRWRPSVNSRKSEVELVLQANYLEVCNSQRSQVIAAAPDVKCCFDEYWAKYESCPLKGRDGIIKSVCPQVYGLQVVKLALLLTVITGSNHETDDDKRQAQDENDVTRVRGQCHLLLVGDPGTGKSQLLRAGVDLTPRSVFTSGAGSTRAGLTCSALREDGEWQLEAGALVLSDGGVCCIDEISQLRDHDRTAIHEAMEQQTISIAKAGIVCKLNTRCAVVAACNPKGHYQTDQPLSVNVSLGTPLLSRFDLIFILLDTKNKAWDKLVSSYILFDGVEKQSKHQWSIEKLQMYISLVGPRTTKMTKSANTILRTYYMLQRKSENRDPSRTTVRMLDSLIRLSQAHCRLMYRTTILPTDAVVAVSLVDLSMQDCTLSDTVDALHSTFHKHPDFNYLQTAKMLLTRMNLYEIWQEELLYYAKILQVDHKTLESDINKGSSKLFSKFDDVKDDNIPLSCSLVTSSYFNNKKEQKHEEFSVENKNIDSENADNIVVNERLAVTLKKHATMNKEDKKIPNVSKVTKKRKRKEVTADTSILIKNNKQSNKKRKTINKEEMLESEDDSDQNAILKDVPSVNDVFNELGIDFKLKFSPNNVEGSVKNYVNKKQLGDIHKNQDKEDNFANHEDIKIKKEKVTQELKGNTSISGESCGNRTMDKLKQFKFVKNHDLDKIFEKDKPNVEIVKLEGVQENSSNVSVKKPSLPNSQISIFESSDCELDLDL